MAKANLKRKVRKKRYKHTVINKKKYYFYKITWSDILGDSSHNSAEEFDKMKPAVMVTQAYVYKKTKNILLTFSSYDTSDEVFSDRNAFPIGCIVKLEKITL